MKEGERQGEERRGGERRGKQRKSSAKERKKNEGRKEKRREGKRIWMFSGIFQSFYFLNHSFIHSLSFIHLFIKNSKKRINPCYHMSSFFLCTLFSAMIFLHNQIFFWKMLKFKISFTDKFKLFARENYVLYDVVFSLFYNLLFLCFLLNVHTFN